MASSWSDAPPASWSDAPPEEARALDVWPLDESNVKLLDAVRPRAWEGPTEAEAAGEYDIIAIGSGAGGLVTAKQAARRGARSALISGHLAGGDCLNVGCVPSKALLHCARAAREARAALAEGFLVAADGTAPKLEVDFDAVMARMRRLRAHIAPADSHEGSAAAGAHVYQGWARFSGPDTVVVNERTLRFKKCVIATGGRAAVPPTPGLAAAPYVTNATLYNLTALPPRMVVLGAGVIGMEMAQARRLGAFAAFGSQVTVLARSAVLSKEEPAAREAVVKALEADGVAFVSGVDVKEVPTLRPRPPRRTCNCEALLVATGRTPNVDGLGLDAAGVAHCGKEGIAIDDLGATSNPRVYAVGDCAAGVPRFTHMSGEMAKLAVQNALFGDGCKVSSLVVPRCCYTEPEVASVGLTRRDAEAAGVAVDTYSSSLEHNDRFILEGQAAGGGIVEIHCSKDTDTIVGATVVAAGAGNIINEVTLAMQAGVGLGAVARVIHPYPTVGEGVMQAGLGYIRRHWAKLN
ncbi:putative mercuric reductase [Emiliania huxleyi CCMP1516]|uniref:Mercuric reductase n=2 Tax=Emiliania huxleyi TaxID=2903 RepID=A0A0D3I208_EMIH1|nr:putative mercuric reductase [Emiliania huxleyi CCMP1516]EOD05293.1 putative mercuric reductase [Emiliania huxleyi CCMP1516]|eukprot:XP_005757722.1 putative mercuric reductase [Emiliania huxleyi CCMP1516]